MSPEIALQVKCPVCQKSLMDRRHKLDGHPSVSLVMKLKGKKGWLRLARPVRRGHAAYNAGRQQGMVKECTLS